MAVPQLGQAECQWATLGWQEAEGMVGPGWMPAPLAPNAWP